MFKPRPCGCKGVRTCLICEEEFGIAKRYQDSIISGTAADEENGKSDKEVVYEYCHLCDKAWRGTDVTASHPDHTPSIELSKNGNAADETGTGIDTEPPPSVIDFPGILLVPDFLSEEEETALVDGCDSMPWDLSQSGRRKQNFGPKTNFKKKKMKAGPFAGFPEFSRFAQEKLVQVPLLSDFQTIEQCSIEYRPETGAHIDPHIDDCWVWGERVISLNLLSDSVLSLNKYRLRPGEEKPRYNLEYYKNQNQNQTSNDIDKDSALSRLDPRTVVRVPMPRRSLLVLYGAARYEWEHAVLRADIHDRRICLAYREFTEEYLPGGESFTELGADVIEKAKSFW